MLHWKLPRNLVGQVACALLLMGICCSLPAVASSGAPQEWSMGFIPGASPIRTMMDHFHDVYLVPMMFGVSAFVLGLLVYVLLRFNKRASPQPKQFTHNALIEILWTAVPVIILMIIAIPSMDLLYYGDKVDKPDLTVKVTGRQWYWSYEYPDHGNFGFDSRPIWDSSAVTEEKAAELLKEAQPNWLTPTPKPLRLLETDRRLVVPVGANIRVLIAGADVIHSWYVPALGVQKSAMPGRLNETWMKADRAGVFYGQCTQICGIGHGYMPIVVEAVAPDRFEAWVNEQKAANNAP